MFELKVGQHVSIKASGEIGVVDGRAEYAKDDNYYYIHYRAADGRAVYSWFPERHLSFLGAKLSEGSNVELEAVTNASPSKAVLHEGHWQQRASVIVEFFHPHSYPYQIFIRAECITAIVSDSVGGCDIHLMSGEKINVNTTATMAIDSITASIRKAKESSQHLSEILPVICLNTISWEKAGSPRP